MHFVILHSAYQAHEPVLVNLNLVTTIQASTVHDYTLDPGHEIVQTSSIGFGDLDSTIDVTEDLDTLASLTGALDRAG